MHEDDIDKLPEPGLYRHYKGALYRVLHCGRHTETREWFACYHSDLDSTELWVRPLDLFNAMVTLEDGLKVPRFQRVHSRYNEM